MSFNVTGGLPGPGQTLLSGNGRTISDSMAASLEGTVAHFEDMEPSSGGPAKRRTNQTVTRVLVRNVSGFALAPKRLVRWKAGYEGRRVDGYTSSTAERVAGVVDEHLPDTGVPNNDLFWLTVEGNTLFKNSTAGDATNVINSGDFLVALTGASSGATNAGRGRAWDGTVGTGEAEDGTLTKYIHNTFGRALSSSTTANTNADILANVFTFRR